MAEEIEHCAMVEGPFHGKANGLEKIVQLPAAAAKSGDVADRAHGHFNQSRWISKWLGQLLGSHNALVDAPGRLGSVFVHGVGRVLAAHPFEAKSQKHLLQV